MTKPTVLINLPHASNINIGVYFKVKYSDEKIKTRVNQFLSDVLDDRKYNVDKARRLI